MPLLNKSLMMIVGVATVLTLFAPAASAQQGSSLSLDISNDFTSYVKPGSEARTFKITPTYSFNTVAQGAITPVSGNVVITMAFDCPPGVVVSGPGNMIVPVTANAQNTQSKGNPVSYSLSAARSVPGLQALQCKVTGTSSNLNDQTAKGATVTQTLAFTVDYYGLVSAAVDSKISDAGPQKQIPYTIQFTNFGNAKTQVNFELVGDTPGKWNPVVPDPIILDAASTAGGQSSGSRVFAIGTPYHNGWNNEETTFTLKMTPVAAESPDKAGSVQTAAVLARVRGIYVPGPEPMLLVAAVLGAALIARLARKDA